MKPTEFQAKRKDTGEWVYGYYDGWQRFPVIREKDGYAREVLPETVSQFTGLTDKNGVKIFEGDRVCVEGMHGLVEWNGGRARFEYRWEGGEITSPLPHVSVVNPLTGHY